jgi:hypothetical protein
MRALIRPSTISRLAAAVASLWLCGGGSAWAGTGGSDTGTLQQIVGPPDGSSGFCNLLGMGPKSAAPLGPTTNPCPQIPTITQWVLEVAGLTNSPPEAIRAQNSITPGSSVTAGNVAAVPTGALPDYPLPLNATSSPPLFSPGNATTAPSGLLTTLTPIAFASQNPQISTTAAATPLYDPSADTFVYAVGVSSKAAVNAAGLTDPDKVYFFFDDHFTNTNQKFSTGQIVAKFSFPLTFLNNDGSESPVMTTLQVTATCNGGPSCLTAQAVGGIGTPKNPVDASQLGIQFALVFSGSPTLAQNHAIFEVAVPLLVTGACVQPNAQCTRGQRQMPPTQPIGNADPAYNYFQHFGLPGPINTAISTAFGSAGDDLGGTPTQSGILPSGAFSVGLAPSAGPLCTFDAMGNETCPSTFALCASLPDNTNGGKANLRPAVGAYYAIATNGETLLSAPLPSVSMSSCQL